MISASRREDLPGIVRTRGFWSGPARPVIVAHARQAVAAFAAAGLSEARSDDLRICVSEAVTNAVVHAFRDGQLDGTITISAEFGRDALTVTVADDGVGFRPRSDSPGVGLGLPTISALADSLTVVTRPRGGTEVSIAFHLAHPAESSVEGA
jgi:anti-sigma regulatory factor (Ser/Thr protein kinase)